MIHSANVDWKYLFSNLLFAEDFLRMTEFVCLQRELESRWDDFLLQDIIEAMIESLFQFRFFASVVNWLPSSRRLQEPCRSERKQFILISNKSPLITVSCIVDWRWKLKEKNRVSDQSRKTKLITDTKLHRTIYWLIIIFLPRLLAVFWLLIVAMGCPLWNEKTSTSRKENYDKICCRHAALMTLFAKIKSNIFRLIYLFIPTFPVITNVIHGLARFVCQIISRIIIIKQPSVDWMATWMINDGRHACIAMARCKNWFI